MVLFDSLQESVNEVCQLCLFLVNEDYEAGGFALSSLAQIPSTFVE